MNQVSEHFTEEEFACKCCGKVPPKPTLKKLSARSERIRSVCGNLPMTITSAYRCAKHNEAIGGVKGSYHTKGMAIDFQIKRKTPVECFKLVSADTILSRGGLGLYKEFVHSDSGAKRRWNEL